ncbi:MAG TPA: hypothetical protein VE868_05600 [Balneolaceae bacterium]|nr:hypothetical protein [Balneolaceae bacterium]
MEIKREQHVVVLLLLIATHLLAEHSGALALRKRRDSQKKYLCATLWPILGGAHRRVFNTQVYRSAE